MVISETIGFGIFVGEHSKKAKVREIYFERVVMRLTLKSISKRFNVSINNIHLIENRKIWKHLTL